MEHRTVRETGTTGGHFIFTGLGGERTTYMERGKREIACNGGDFQYLIKCYLFGLGSACLRV